ncbi:hypothetical protein RvY_04417 [Ramazzottius varieornatus]|uniref:Uncharacterized protein n=1 Tax=Ramazzottius varieornatus TaxID=947166 RepID=A0A1D1US93_RAMVA|nr:hypothetical protein RvY_04417 [Ramazzottius varieornatus]
MSATGLPNNKLKSTSLNHTSWLTKNGETLKAEYKSRFSAEVDYVLAAYVIVLWIVTLYVNGAIVMKMQGKCVKRRSVDGLLGYLAFSNGLQAITTLPFLVVTFLCHWWAFGDTDGLHRLCLPDPVPSAIFRDRGACVLLPEQRHLSGLGRVPLFFAGEDFNRHNASGTALLHAEVSALCEEVPILWVPSMIFQPNASA